MPPFRPKARLETHEVLNQPPPPPSHNAYADDALMRPPRLRDSAFLGAPLHDPSIALLTKFGARCGSEEARELGRLANDNPPKLRAFDRYG
jgi:putative acyl-CoA dehydrogenase